MSATRFARKKSGASKENSGNVVASPGGGGMPHYVAKSSDSREQGGVKACEGAGEGALPCLGGGGN